MNKLTLKLMIAAALLLNAAGWVPVFIVKEHNGLWVANLASATFATWIWVTVLVKLWRRKQL